MIIMDITGVSNCSGIMTSRAADESAGVTLRPCCSALTPPGLNVSYDWCSEGVNFSLAICAACFAPVVAVRDVVLFLGWNNLFLFYDGSLCKWTVCVCVCVCARAYVHTRARVCYNDLGGHLKLGQ